jgi:negative regulator of sigma E activity
MENTMKNKSLLRNVFLCVLSFSAIAWSQDKPNFSGTWKQNMEKSSTKSSWLKSYVNKIEQTDTTLKVTTTTVGDRGERTYDRTYTIGKEETSKGSDGDEFTTTVKFDKSSLMFDTVEKERGTNLTSHETWTLSPDGKTLTKVLKRSGPRGDSEQQYVLEKQVATATAQ